MIVLKHRYAFALSILFVLGLLLYLDPAYFFTGDPLNKLIQTRSLLEFGFASEELWYPARFIDPDFTFYPHPGVYIIKVGERYLGQYPLLFSVLCAPFLYLFGPSSLGVLSALLILVTLFVLYRFWKVRPEVLLFVVFCTPLVARGIEYAENIHVILLALLSFSLYLVPRGREDRDAGSEPQRASPGRLFIAGLVLGGSVWLRHEGALFFAAFSAALATVFLLRAGIAPGSPAWRGELKRFLFREYFFFGLGFALPVLAFFLFNYLDYGHILGPRFISNVEKFYKPLSARLRQTLTLLFFGSLKVGFFGFTPLFLIVFVLAALPRFYARLGRGVQTLFWTLVFFIPMICYIAVSDGTVTWGPRYLILAILPASLILNRFAEMLAERAGGRRTRLLYTGIVVLCLYSLAINLVGLRFMRASTRQLEVVSKKFNTVPADLRLYQNPFLASHEGSDYFDNLTLLARKEEELPLLFERLRAKAPDKTIVFFETTRPMDPVFDDVGRPPWMKIDHESYRRRLESGLQKIEVRDLGEIRATLFRIPAGAGPQEN